MPAQSLIHEAEKLVVTELIGEFTRSEYQRLIFNLARDQAFNPDYGHLIDCRKLAHLNIGFDEIRQLGTRSIFSEHSHCAVLVSNEMQAGMAKMLAQYREQMAYQKVMVCRTLAECRKYLSLPKNMPDKPLTLPRIIKP